VRTWLLVVGHTSDRSGMDDSRELAHAITVGEKGARQVGVDEVGGVVGNYGQG